VRRGALFIAPLVVLLLAACGSSGGSNSTTTQQPRLSAAAYGNRITQIGKEASAAQALVAKGLHAKTVAELSQRVGRFAADTQRIGDEVAKLNPPKNAEAANTQLAQGLHDIATATKAASVKLAKMKTVQAAVQYLEHSSAAQKGSNEVTGALTTLDQLGYSGGS